MPSKRKRGDAQRVFSTDALHAKLAGPGRSKSTYECFLVRESDRSLPATDLREHARYVPAYEPLRGTLAVGKNAVFNDVILTHEHVSDRHAAIVRVEPSATEDLRSTGGALAFVYDLASTNGTYVNDTKVGIGGQALYHGDVLRFGNPVDAAVKMRFQTLRDLSAETNQSGSDDVELGGHLTCPTCMQIFKDPVNLTCGHALCAGCAAELAIMKGVSPISTSVSCPMCRVSVRVKEATPSFVLGDLANMIRDSQLSERERAEVCVRQSEQIRAWKRFRSST